MSKSELESTGSIREFIGRKIRAYRKVNGLTLQMLAERLDVGYQQVQKYEKGKNAISAEALWTISRIFCIPPSELYPTSNDPGAAKSVFRYTHDAMVLLRAFLSMSPTSQKLILDFAKLMTKSCKE